MRSTRTAMAIIITVVVAPIGVWAALLAALTLVSQVLAGFGVIVDADWTQLLNPAVWLGFTNVAGNGSLLDSLVGGPGAPGGTAGRYVAFFVQALIAFGCYTAVTASWSWARRPD